MMMIMIMILQTLNGALRVMILIMILLFLRCPFRVFFVPCRTAGRASHAKAHHAKHYRGTSLIRNSAPLGPYSRTMPRALWGS